MRDAVLGDGEVGTTTDERSAVLGRGLGIDAPCFKHRNGTRSSREVGISAKYPNLLHFVASYGWTMGE